MRGDSLEHRYCAHKGLARVSNSRGTRETVPYAIVESKRVQRSFDSRSAAALLRASLRMTSEKSQRFFDSRSVAALPRDSLRMTAEKSERSDSCVVAISCLSQRPSQSREVLAGAPG